jgi:hypothetical protein
VSDPESPSGSDDSGSDGWLSAFLSSTPKVIGSVTALIGAVTGLLIALNKAGLIGAGGNESSGGTTTTSEPAKTLFGPMTRPIGRVYFDGTTMYVRASKPRKPLLHLADQDKELEDVSMITRVKWVSGSNDYGFSIICRYTSPGNYYLLGVLSGGRYNIGRYRDGVLSSLTHGIQKSTYVSDDANDVTARCVGAKPTTLTLMVNGHLVGEAQDRDGLDSGNVGIRVGSGESFVTCSFEDFVLKYL